MLYDIIKKTKRENQVAVYIDSTEKSVNEFVYNGVKVFTFNFPPIAEDYKELFNNTSSVVFVLNGYEGKQAIIKNLMHYYAHVQPGTVFVVAIGRKKGGKNFIHLLQRVFIDITSNIQGDCVLYEFTKQYADYAENNCMITQYADIEIIHTFGNVEVIFKTEHGMFSPEKIDGGSEFIVNVVCRRMTIKANSKILDFGCAYGAMGLPLALIHPDASFVLIDNNPRCIYYAKKNIEANNAKNCECYVSEGLSGLGRNDKYDVIVSHFPMHISTVKKAEILSQCHLHLNNSGLLVLVMLSKYKFDCLTKGIFSLVYEECNGRIPEYTVYYYQKESIRK